LSESLSSRDYALEQLTSEFPTISVRIIVKVFLRYLETCDSLPSAVESTRARIIDACVTI
jgi:hypothetical protein